VVSRAKLRPIELCPNGHHYNATQYGDTCPVCGAKLDEDSRKTQEELEKELTLESEEWVCAWLVCISGLNKGRSYVIRSGKNPIGRDISMSIRVLGDPNIEPKNHGIIIYESKKMEATLLPGDSKGLVYVEGDVIFKPTTLTSFDEIQIGDSVFRYVAFCGERFSWGKSSEDEE